MKNIAAILLLLVILPSILASRENARPDRDSPPPVLGKCDDEKCYRCRFSNSSDQYSNKKSDEYDIEKQNENLKKATNKARKAMGLPPLTEE